MRQELTQDVVRGLPLFSGLNGEERDDIAREARVRRYPSGRRLFGYGDAVLHYYIVCDGAIQLFRETPDGCVMTSDFLIAGATLGIFEALQALSTYQVNAVAIRDTTVLEFPIGWIRENAGRHSTFAVNLLAMFAQRAQTFMIESEHKSTMSAAQQVACFLQRLCVFCQRDPVKFELPFSKTLLASRLGMKPETFSRALNTIREQGFAIKGMRVGFEDVSKIEDFVCSKCSIFKDCREHEHLKRALSCAQNPGNL
jgi:CRP-like cAMP-binding protein